MKSLPGKPDIVLKKYRTVIFVNGCFWHGHERCKYFVIPQTRTVWWTEKIRKNKERDSEEREKLRGAEWNIIVVWECQLKPKQRMSSLSVIESLLQQSFLNMNRRTTAPAYSPAMIAKTGEVYK
ncbi:very short patch repair endonuclease [Odoribacter lunatus]|uniref:very short patch repair endonuclease n=1 Tax=Odoribacter lunatus TaxID=2941335 RepID=UPI0030B9EDB5